ncbi:GNAT family N-acetyltransferase [Cohnella endophytica]|uniref:GNAT family N-acetyltransferase n=1 Tax=Cohnella endophytica TaxID=2419778 RepID=A0A494XRF4_9BACL|nr:GNAT family N-acetyltransferase [Cohnella endophytica]RKP53227.1 GNAT family N-acetyltransferase [Cohnella endophytica]
MRISAYERRYLRQTIELWNLEAVQEDYKELDEESFDRIFAGNPYFDKFNAFLLLDSEDQVKGFACGCTGEDLPLGDTAGYLTCVVIAGEFRNDENYGLLLDEIERRFLDLGKKQSDVLFFNPMMLPWTIPGTPKHEHNNAPGVPLEGELYGFLLRRGYVERAKENAMYLELSGFSIPEEIRAKEEKARADSYEVELYDPNKHEGLDRMLGGLNNPLWIKEISRSAAEGVPFVLAAKDGTAVGFAGPVIRQDNGRGYFAGIGVLPEHEGHGLGSILFFKLCEAFRQIGTEYMSLYTGSTNPAIRIYEKAGFRTVKQFAVMRRELLR